jgi:dihydroneopterin triphosphate diphosphatase
MPGPAIRTDIVEVFVFRRPPAPGIPRSSRGSTRVEFLQLRRNKPPASGTWQPVMGHIDEGETAVRAALRELREETGYDVNKGLLGFWQLESLDTFFLAGSDTVMMCPLFAAEVAPGREPTLDDTHDAHRWVARDAADRAFLWPGQRAAVAQIVCDILPEASPTAALLRIELPR